MASVRLTERTWVMYLTNGKHYTQLAMIRIPLTLGGKGICAKGRKGDTKKSHTGQNKRLVLGLVKYVPLPCLPLEPCSGIPIGKSHLE